MIADAAMGSANAMNTPTGARCEGMKTSGILARPESVRRQNTHFHFRMTIMRTSTSAASELNAITTAKIAAFAGADVRISFDELSTTDMKTAAAITEAEKDAATATRSNRSRSRANPKRASISGRPNVVAKFTT